MDRNALAELLQALESRRDAEERRREERYTALIERDIRWSKPHEGELLAMKKGGGQETSSPSRTFAAGGTVAEAPEEGATSQEDMGGGGSPTMATPMDYSRPLFQDIETEGGGGRWGHVCFAQGGDM
ncbi:UNVERIFIED_CONTAM: hypothetical protein FKN15_048900 [Acipenser sinensis]